jgi:hypothetical protein
MKKPVKAKAVKRKAATIQSVDQQFLDKISQSMDSGCMISATSAYLSFSNAVAVREDTIARQRLNELTSPKKSK